MEELNCVPAVLCRLLRRDRSGEGEGGGGRGIKLLLIGATGLTGVPWMGDGIATIMPKNELVNNKFRLVSIERSYKTVY